jgi:hypothetical protein
MKRREAWFEDQLELDPSKLVFIDETGAATDEATNTTSYLLVLERHGLIQRHVVERPFAKDDFGKWTHWAALIRERERGELFAIDSSGSVNGENPTVQSAASFYVPDGVADNKPPETSGYTASDSGSSYSGNETGSVR